MTVPTVKQRIQTHLRQSIETKQQMLRETIPAIEAAALAIVDTFFKRGGIVYTFGNGGSAADAQHIAGELLCMLRTDNNFDFRLPLPAHALTTDTSVMSAVANDLGFEFVFSRQLEALAKPEDLVIAISTSGNSPNVVKALELTKARGIQSVAFTGRDGGTLRNLADILIAIPADDVALIQEGHVTAFHSMCDVMEELLFGSKGLRVTKGKNQ
ncbi:MAG: SIS domain-containing protein [Pseudomonadota bacterium]